MVRLLQRFLTLMLIVCYRETPYLERIAQFRNNELKYIRSLLLIRSGNNAVAFSLPVLASVLAFVTYSLSGHDLNPAVIFASLTLFQMLRMPLMFLPVALSSVCPFFYLCSFDFADCLLLLLLVLDCRRLERNEPTPGSLCRRNPHPNPDYRPFLTCRARSQRRRVLVGRRTS